MTTKLRFLLCALALSVPGWTSLWADDPASTPKTGKILILENERPLEGDIERQGDQYLIRRGGSEVWLPAAKAQLCASWDEAYQYLCSRANLRDPDERLRLARWCHLYGLREKALLEANAALELRPDHRETKRLLAMFQKVNGSGPVQGSPSPAPAQPLAMAAPSLDVSAETLGMFTTRVQPILMNACASCHATGRGGDFKLTRTYESATINRRSTQQNLAAVLALVDLNHPASSLLLVKAVSIHGNAAQPPLKSRQSPPFRTLEEWVQMTVANNPHLREERWAPSEAAKVAVLPLTPEAAPPVTVAMKPPAPPQTQPAAKNPAASAAANVRQTLQRLTQPQPEAPLPGTVVSGQPTATTPPVRGNSSPEPAVPVAATPADEFDPLIFNTQMHSNGKQNNK
jgi:hypothetical protein